MNRCTNCGSDLSVIRVSACCNHPMRPNFSDADFPKDPIPELTAEIARLQAEVERLSMNLKYHMGLVGGLMSQRDTARNDAIEEAAMVADYYADADYCAMGYPEDGGIAASGTAHTIATAIRALIR